ncbi:MAG: ATP-binding protein [Chloroflexota bacterium]
MTHSPATTTPTDAHTGRTLLHLRTLYNVSRALGQTVQIERTLGLIAEHLAAVPAIDRCAVWLAGENRTLVVAATWGLESETLEGLTLSPSKQSFVTRALRQGQYQTVDNRHPERSSRDALARHFAARAALAMPLISEDKPSGIITVDSLSDENPFDDATIDLVRSVAEQAAVAIQTARLYDQLSRLNQELEARVEQRTAELERALRDLERLERAKSDFISIASHELKTPLTLIQGYANILRESLSAEDTQRRGLVQGIVTGGQRLQSIVEDMIDVSLIDTQVLTLHVIPTSLRQVIDLAAAEFEAALKERRHELTIEGLDDLPLIEGDPQRLHQAFVHLIGNAIKFTPDGGRIDVLGQLFSGRLTNERDFVEIAIADTGIGIDPEHHERIFEKFYQLGDVTRHSSGKTKFKGGGPGLGLPIAKGVIEAHGGKVWVESPGHDEERHPGSVFHILLPVQAAHTASEQRVRRELKA